MRSILNAVQPLNCTFQIFEWKIEDSFSFNLNIHDLIPGNCASLHQEQLVSTYKKLLWLFLTFFFSFQKRRENEALWRALVMSESMIRKRAMAQHLSRAEPPSKSHFRVCNVRFPLEIRFKMVCNAEARNLFHSRK